MTEAWSLTLDIFGENLIEAAVSVTLDVHHDVYICPINNKTTAS